MGAGGWEKRGEGQTGWGGEDVEEEDAVRRTGEETQSTAEEGDRREHTERE